MSEHEPKPEDERDRDDAGAEQADDRKAIRNLLEGAKTEYQELGGWDALASGEWLWVLIHRSFKDYWERATAEYFFEKYGTTDPDRISAKLISVASRNSALLGAVTGAAVSADEIVAILKAADRGGAVKAGVSLPANLAIAATALGAETVLLVRFQLQLVANLAKVYGVPLDPDDPEDILTILAYALGGSVADAAGKAGAKIGGRLGGRAAKAVFSKDLLAALKRVGAKAGIKILQRTIAKYVVPIVSVAIGTGWNYLATKSVGRIAIRHLQRRAEAFDSASGGVDPSAGDVGLTDGATAQADDEDGCSEVGGETEPAPDPA